MHYTGPKLQDPIQGDYTGAWYKFHRMHTLYVDRRDAVYMLGPDMEIVVNASSS